MNYKTKFRVFFLIPPEVQLLDFAGPAQLFYEAKEYGADIDVHYLSLDKNLQQSSSAGISMGNLEFFERYRLNKEDLLFIPGLESHLLLSEQFKQKHSLFFEWLKTQNKTGVKICSVCTGAYLMGMAGVLDEKECTTHWKYIEDFKNRFPRTKVLSDRLIVKDGNIYSSAGVSSGIDLALYIIEELLGPVFASKIAKEVVIYSRRTPKDPQLSIYLRYRNHLDNRIHMVQDLLSQHLEEKVKVETLAETVHMSRRNLTRLFKNTTGITIGDYLDQLRTERATQLLSNGSKISAAAQACGLKSSNQLRALLKKHQR
ncbi:DJ-1/PfpI family protein [Muricauda oceani]|uniref:AraC family transcriptional regulator n=1 Tax=Flagellimonas oceani TaxID=2698672 RepID=A0A6G7IYE8_9FLAO|nr:DJ-1/PfpI family protein [Allomuricauda oceani]MBW8244954.1 DJ-1/PfpI family protein [Allomuricauda oceani]QII43344.1 AraC family transcriptional regulator [Allomuricauda oceani]